MFIVNRAFIALLNLYFLAIVSEVVPESTDQFSGNQVAAVLRHQPHYEAPVPAKVIDDEALYLVVRLALFALDTVHCVQSAAHEADLVGDADGGDEPDDETDGGGDANEPEPEPEEDEEDFVQKVHR